MESLLLQFFIFLSAAIIAVPCTKKLGLGSVLGYLVAGIIIGPYGTSLIHEVKVVIHFTEFGVVMMLFLVGLELKPSLLWKLRLPILGMGGLQVIASSLIIGGLSGLFLPWKQAMAVGLILSLSSTAIVLQTLQEKGQLDTGAGRSIFSVLLFQDLAIIPILAGLPLLATLVNADHPQYPTLLFDISTFPAYLRLIMTISAISFVLLIGKFACDPLFRLVASTGMREMFVAAALALIIGISVLMLAVGLSPALGAFLAGVMLSDSEFRHQLESDIGPFKGLLLGIFFIAIGAGLNFSLIYESPGLIFGIALGLILVKWLILLVVGFLFRIPGKERSLFTIALAQGGEFAFVLFHSAEKNAVLPSATIDPLISAVVISMFLTPLLFILHEKITRKQIDTAQQQEATDNIAIPADKVILAGFGRLGTDVGRFLLATGIKPTILDHDSGNVRILRKFGFEVYYGDATRLDLLESAGASKAKLLIITIGDTERVKQLTEIARKHYPHLKIIVNAKDRQAAFDMMELGVKHVCCETFGTALDIGRTAIQELGMDPYKARRFSLIFKKKDKKMMSELYELRSEEASYISHYQNHHENLEKLMALDKNKHMEATDKAWTSRNPEAPSINDTN